MAEITIELQTPVDAGGGEKVTEVVLREPRMRELLAYGKPFRWVSVLGKPQLVEDDDTIQSYIKALTVKPAVTELLGNVKLADGLAIREAFLDFFVKSERSAGERATKTPSA